MRNRHSPVFRAVASMLTGLIAAPAWAGAAPDSAPAAAESPRKPRVVVVSFALDGSERASAKLSYLAERIVQEQGRHELLDLAAALDPEEFRAHQTKVDTAREAIDKARAHYDELEPKRAKDQCDRAIEELENSDLSRSFDQLVKAKMLRIASLIANAETSAAEVALEQLLPTDLATPFDPNLFAPDFIAQTKARRAELKTQASQGLDIEARPVAARVFIDGRYRGISSVELRNLTPGDHVLTLIAPGYKVLQKVVRPGAGGTRVENLQPASGLGQYEATLRRIRADFRGEGRNRAARELAKQLGVEQIVVLGVQAKDKDQLLALAVRVDAADGHEYAYVEEPLPNDEHRFGKAADEYLRRVFATDKPRGEGGKPIATTGGGFEWRARHTGYLLLGVAALALGSGVYFGLNANNYQNDYRNSLKPQTHPDYQQLESDGRRSALVADVSYLAAIIAGGTGLFLAITGRGLEQEDDVIQIEEKKRVSRSPRAEDDLVPASPTPKKSAPSKSDDDDLGGW